MTDIQTSQDQGRKVYVVWTGEYSDKQVMAIFIDKELAENLVDAMAPLLPTARWEEYPLNLVRLIPHCFECHMDRNGEVTYCDAEDQPQTWDIRLAADHELFTFGDGRIGFSAWGTTPVHAKNNCADFRRAWLATNESHP